MGADLPLMLRASSVVTAQGFGIEVVASQLGFAVLDETEQYFLSSTFLSKAPAVLISYLQLYI